MPGFFIIINNLSCFQYLFKINNNAIALLTAVKYF